MIGEAVTEREQLVQQPGRGQAFVHDDGVVGQDVGDHLGHVAGVDGLRTVAVRQFRDQAAAPGRPVGRGQCGDGRLGAGRLGVAADPGQHVGEGGQGGLQIAQGRDLDRIVLGDVPFVEADLHDLHAVGQGIDGAVDRHGQGVGAEGDHQIMGLERRARLFLHPFQRPHETGMFRQELRAVRRRRLEHGRAEDCGEGRGLGEGVAFHHLVADHDHRVFGGQDALGQGFQHVVGRAHAGVDAGC